MKALARRGFLRSMAAIPAAAAQAQAALAETMSMASKIATSSPDQPPPSGGGIPMGHNDPSTEQIRMLLKLPAARAQIESQTFQSYRHVSALDPDLANKRSFSLAAKVTFQRQRNVAAQMDALVGDYHWRRVDGLVSRLLGLR